MSDIEGWQKVEECPWEAISHLGQNWMVKATACDQGYAVMVTNGCCLWGEKRSTEYITEKADEWASCIEAGIEELSLLVLSEMKKNADVFWEDDGKAVRMTIDSKLNDMSYSWVFRLKRLSDELFNHHWVVPFWVNFHHMGLTVKQLTRELDNKSRQLEELLPDKKTAKNSNKSAGRNKVTTVDVSVDAVLSSGAVSITEAHNLQYQQIMRSLRKRRNAECKNDSPQRPPVDNASRNVKQVQEKTEEELEQEELEKQQERRAKIQEIMQGTAPRPSPQKKKKKKLNL